MTRIRITPEELIRTGQQFSEVLGKLQQVSGELGNALNGIGNEYDGQLRRQAEPHVGQGQNAIQSRSGKLGSLSEELARIANAFLTVDQAGIKGMIGLSPQSAQLSESGAVLAAHTEQSRLQNATIENWLNLGNFGSFVHNEAGFALSMVFPSLGIFYWGGKIFTSIFSSSAGSKSTPQPSAPPKAPQIPVSSLKQSYLDMKDLALRTPGTGGDGWYFYYGDKDNTVKSDCTWYVATAIAFLSAGKINLNATPNENDNIAKVKMTNSEWEHYMLSQGKTPESLGNAYDWHINADKYAKAFPSGPIKSVDKIPQSGSIYNKDWSIKDKDGNDIRLGHVAMVESAELNKDKTSWTIKVSEEDAYGNGLGGKLVELNDGSGRKRWERTFDQPVNSDTNHSVNDETVFFIHLNYPKN